MRTVTVKLNKSDYELLQKNIELLQKSWVYKMTLSEAIRYAIYVLNCELNESIGDECLNCTKKHYKNR